MRPRLLSHPRGQSSSIRRTSGPLAPSLRHDGIRIHPLQSDSSTAARRLSKCNACDQCRVRGERRGATASVAPRESWPRCFSVPAGSTRYSHGRRGAVPFLPQREQWMECGDLIAQNSSSGALKAATRFFSTMGERPVASAPAPFAAGCVTLSGVLAIPDCPKTRGSGSLRPGL